jgi:hypothetical protein
MDDDGARATGTMRLEVLRRGVSTRSEMADMAGSGDRWPGRMATNHVVGARRM